MVIARDKHFFLTFKRLMHLFSCSPFNTRDVFYVRREVDLMKTSKVNAYIMHIFGKIELLSIYAS